MLAKDLITDEIPPLKTSDTGLMAINWMDEFKVSQLPIVDNYEYLGLISDTDILDLNITEEELGKNKLSLFHNSPQNYNRSSALQPNLKWNVRFPNQCIFIYTTLIQRQLIRIFY